MPGQPLEIFPVFLENLFPFEHIGAEKKFSCIGFILHFQIVLAIIIQCLEIIKYRKGSKEYSRLDYSKRPNLYLLLAAYYKELATRSGGLLWKRN